VWLGDVVIMALDLWLTVWS